MRINFFEEFPIDENLEKARLIDFDSTIYIAANSFQEFQVLRKKLNKINPKLEAGYWPILEKSYWISPFSCTYELKNLIKNLQKINQNNSLKILIDLELPVLNKKLFLKNLFSFSKNKRLIRKIFEKAQELNIEILTAEYPVPNKFFQKKLECLGISYSFEKYPHKKIVMLYSSVIKNKFILNQALSQMKKFIIAKSKKYGQNFQVGLGAIAKGILCNEPILTPKQLYEDLKFLKENKINETTIFRLGGLDKKYLKVIEEFSY